VDYDDYVSYFSWEEVVVDYYDYVFYFSWEEVVVVDSYDYVSYFSWEEVVVVLFEIMMYSMILTLKAKLILDN